MSEQTPGSMMIQFRAGELRTALEGRASASLSVDLVAKRDLGRYYTLLDAVRPTFSEAEASLILDACNGIVWDQRSVGFLWAEVADGIKLDGLDEKWGVDGGALVKRLRALPFAELQAIADASERWWGLAGAGEPVSVWKSGLVEATT